MKLTLCELEQNLILHKIMDLHIFPWFVCILKNKPFYIVPLSFFRYIRVFIGWNFKLFWYGFDIFNFILV